MTKTPELDRAIVVARSKVASVLGWRPKDDDRTYARALVAELLRGVDDDAKELWAIRPDMGAGFVSALAEIRRRAGIVEGEG